MYCFNTPKTYANKFVAGEAACDNLLNADSAVLTVKQCFPDFINCDLMTGTLIGNSLTAEYINYIIVTNNHPSAHNFSWINFVNDV